MSTRLRVSAVLLVTALVSARPAHAADVTKPLRTLLYTLAVSAGVVRHTPDSGLSPTPVRTMRANRTNSNAGARPLPRGHDDASGGSVKTEGTIAVEVVAATGDGGLVADLAETAPKRTRPKVRFAVLPDGTVSFDPHRADDVSEEEILLARWLSRGFYGDRPQDVGAAWTVDQSGDGTVSAEHYRVLSVAEPTVTLTYSYEEKESGPAALVATRSGSLVYDTRRVVPVHAEVESRGRRDLGGSFDESLLSVTMTLAADSFSNRF